MGLFDLIFKNRPKERGTYQGSYQLLNGYMPHFSQWGGDVYESELIRAAINARATHISKLRIEMLGAARPALRAKLQHAPNELQTWSKFLYRLSTILDVHNTAFIVPVYDRYGEPSGIYTVLPSKCELVQYGNVPYLRYKFDNGDVASIELEYCGIMTKFQYRSDVFGENNHALFPTMDMIHIQNQGIEEGVKSAASYRFMAKVSNFTKSEDLAKERRRFTAENFSRESEGGGILLFPNTYTDIKQVEAKPWVVDADQMKLIKDNVFEYFGVNEEILQSKAYGDAWSAFYESVIEAFAVQFSEVMTKMLFTLREQSAGNMVKLDVSTQLVDRGLMSINDAREIWQLPPVEGGDVRIIRGEYYNVDDRVVGGENNDEGNQSV